MTETYEVGELIYHPIFEDKGKITDKFFTTGGNEVIIVNFPKAGRKVLMQGMSEENYY